MVVVLFDHVGEHVLGVLLECLVPDARTAPWHLFPDHQTEFVAQVEDNPVLLVVSKPNKIRAHLADQLHLLSNEVITHRSGETGMIGMALRAAKENTLAIELEWAMLDELEMADPKALFLDALAG